MTAPRDRQSYLQGRIDAFEEAAKSIEATLYYAWGGYSDGYGDGFREMQDSAVSDMRDFATAARAELAAATDTAPEEGQG